MTNALSSLPLAYKQKMDWLDTEQKAAHAEMLIRLLRESRELTSACAERLPPSLEELKAINAYFEKMTNDILADQKDTVENIEKYRKQLSEDVPPLIRQMLLVGNDSRNTQVELVFLMSALV